MAEEILTAGKENMEVEKKGKNTFVFHKEWYDAVSGFDNSTRAEILEAIVCEAFDTEKKSLSPLAEMAMSFIRPQIERDNEKYVSICRRNAENGAKGGRRKKPKETQNNPENPVGSLETQRNPDEPKKAHYDNDIQGSKDPMSIYKKDTTVSKKEKPLWKASYDEYRRLFEAARDELLTDSEFRAKQESYYQNIDYEKSIDKAMDYWLAEETWKKVSRERVQTINPKERLKKNFDKNRIYRPYSEKGGVNPGYPASVDDVSPDDVSPSYDYYCYWMEGKSRGYTLYDRMPGGFPQNDSQYQNLLAHTKGGAKGFAYVVLVFVRDGWKEYDDERGFMWIYSNYIKANGLYKD